MSDRFPGSTSRRATPIKIMALGLAVGLAAISGDRGRPLDSLQIEQAAAAGMQAARTDPDQRRGTAKRVPGNRSLISESEPRFSAAELLERFDQISASVTPPLRPPVLILPVVGADNVVRHDGLGLCALAMLALADGPDQPVFPAPNRVFPIVIDSGCWRPATKLDPRLSTALARSCGSQVSVAPSLVSTKSGHLLEVRFTADDADLAGKMFSHEIKSGRLNTVPGIIALDVLSVLGVSLEQAARERVLAPRVNSDEGCTLIGEFLAQTTPLGKNNSRLRLFLAHNPQCTLGWLLLVGRDRDPETAFEQAARFAPGLNRSVLDLTMDSRLVLAGRPAEAWARVVSQLPVHGADPRCLWLLTQSAAALQAPPLVEKLLGLWEQLDPGFRGKIDRGRLFVKWLEAGTFSAGDEEIPQGLSEEGLLRRARREFEQAADLHPDGWEAHAGLIEIAVRSGIPRADVESHFTRAIAVVPGHQPTYRRKLEYLRADGNGNDEELFAFARECTASGLWSQGIPQMVIEAIQEATFDRQTRVRHFANFKSDALWRAVEDYYQAARRSAWFADQRTALNGYALWGALGGHYAEVLDAYRAIHKPYQSAPYDERVFGTPFHFAYLNDLITANAEEGRDSTMARLRLALGAGDLSQAERLMDEIGSSNPDRTAGSCRAAVKVGRRLHAERRIDFSPEQLLDVLIDHGQEYAGQLFESDSVSQSKAWSVDREHVVWDGGRNIYRLFHADFPIGIRHGVISGKLEFSGDLPVVRIILHTHALRDVITLTYYANYPVVTVSRGSFLVGSLHCPAGEKSFRFEFGATADVIEPVPGQRFDVPVVDDVPSGFGLEGVRDLSGGELRKPQGIMKLSQIRIELTD